MRCEHLGAAILGIDELHLVGVVAFQQPQRTLTPAVIISIYLIAIGTQGYLIGRRVDFLPYMSTAQRQYIVYLPGEVERRVGDVIVDQSAKICHCLTRLVVVVTHIDNTFAVLHIEIVQRCGGVDGGVFAVALGDASVVRIRVLGKAHQRRAHIVGHAGLA